MEVELHDHGVDKSSRNREESKVSEKKKANDDVVIDINDEDIGGPRNSVEGSKVCRICLEFGNGGADSHQLIQLGCDCKGGLALSHHNCAAAWFSHKGNTYVTAA
ncbi:hypothetical protein C2S51_015322 [Perilla frutescens var. frutescens]|nr:hypothetical protein C2S51_015322 [Perilla frutescens var. frutescens]